jgi:hypothetical protein
MASLTSPGPTAIQSSTKSPESAWMLSVLAKRTYALASNGELVATDEQLPLTREPVEHPDHPAILAADTDTYPIKLRTDIVILGHAYGNGRQRFEANVVVDGTVVKRMLVIGDRVCTASSGGKPVFSPARPVEAIELSYTRAYGGSAPLSSTNWSTTAREQFQSIAAALEREPSALMDYEYPRNPAGCGFLLDPSPAALSALRLPNLEDPLDPLTPERLAIGDPNRWPTMPLPQSTAWVNVDWFPRIAYLGIPPLAPPDARFAEVERGYASPKLVDPKNGASSPFAFSQGASLGLQLPHLRPGTTVTLENMHRATARWKIRLPQSTPKIWVDGRQGKLKETIPVIHTVLIEPDVNRVSVVWRGAASALRPYLPSELEKMPFRVEWAD